MSTFGVTSRHAKIARCPGALEIGAGLVEGRGGIALMFARMRTRIEAATPFPWVGVKRVADAPRDRPDADIAVVDMPAIWPFGISAAGERGHAALKRDRVNKQIP